MWVMPIYQYNERMNFYYFLFEEETFLSLNYYQKLFVLVAKTGGKFDLVSEEILSV